jgi:hypothetical protein
MPAARMEIELLNFLLDLPGLHFDPTSPEPKIRGLQSRCPAELHLVCRIRCNAVAPGLILTPAVADPSEEALRPFTRQILSRRLGRPEDIAAAVAYLASPDAEYVTGTVLCVDGGMSAHLPYVADLPAVATAG